MLWARWDLARPAGAHRQSRCTAGCPSGGQRQEAQSPREKHEAAQTFPLNTLHTFLTQKLTQRKKKIKQAGFTQGPERESAGDSAIPQPPHAPRGRDRSQPVQPRSQPRRPATPALPECPAGHGTVPARLPRHPRGPVRHIGGTWAAPKPLGGAGLPGSASAAVAPWGPGLHSGGWAASQSPAPGPPSCPARRSRAGDYPQRNLRSPKSQPRRGGWGRSTSGDRASDSPSSFSGRLRPGPARPSPASGSAADERSARLIPRKRRQSREGSARPGQGAVGDAGAARPPLPTGNGRLPSRPGWPKSTRNPGPIASRAGSQPPGLIHPAGDFTAPVGHGAPREAADSVWGSWESWPRGCQ